MRYLPSLLLISHTFLHHICSEQICVNPIFRAMWQCMVFSWFFTVWVQRLRSRIRAGQFKDVSRWRSDSLGRSYLYHRRGNKHFIHLFIFHIFVCLFVHLSVFKTLFTRVQTNFWADKNLHWFAFRLHGTRGTMQVFERQTELQSVT